MNSTALEAQCAENICQMQYNTLFLLLTLRIIHQGQAKHDATFKSS